MTTVTVRFAPTNRSQLALRDVIGQAIFGLRNKGLADDVSVEPVFPDHTDERWKGAFVVKFSGPPHEVVDVLRSIPGVQSANLAPVRGPIRSHAP